MQVPLSTSKLPIVRVRVKGNDWDALVDSGAAVNAVNSAAVHRLGMQVIKPARKSVITAGGMALDVEGEVMLPVELDGTTFLIDALVVPGLPHILPLGMDWVVKMDAWVMLDKRSVTVGYGPRPNCTKAVSSTPIGEITPVTSKDGEDSTPLEFAAGLDEVKRAMEQVYVAKDVDLLPASMCAVEVVIPGGAHDGDMVMESWRCSKPGRCSWRREESLLQRMQQNSSSPLDCRLG